MGKSLKLIASIAIAAFAPYAAAALGLTGFAATAFGFALQLGANAILGGIGGDSGGGAGVSDSGFLVNQQGNTKAIDVIYGNRAIGGTRVYIETTDVNGNSSGEEYLHCVYAVAQGGIYTDGRDSIKSFKSIKFNDRVAWDPVNGIDAYFDGLIDIRLYNGSAGQVYTAPDVTAGPGWAVSDHFATGNHDGKGVAWAYISFKYDRDKVPGLATVIFEVEGKKVWNVNTEAWTTDLAEMRNPANVLYDYLRSSRYGKGLDASVLDLASFKAARTYCNDAGLTIDGAVQTANTIFSNTEQLLAAANSNLVFSNGVYKLVPLKQEDFTGAFTFDSSNITGEWNISLGSKKTRFNTFIVNYFNPDLDWNPDSLNIENATYKAQDNGTINQKSIDLPFSSNKTLATKLANYYLDYSRYQTIVNFTAVHTALQLEVGDPVYVTHDTPGWTNKKFRVLGLTLNPDATVDVTLAEYAPDSVYLENN